MILDALYTFQKLPETKSKTRYDCICNSGTLYQPLESLRNAKGQLFIYYHSVPDRFNLKGRRKPDMAITKGRNISSLFVPEVKQPFAYGDIRTTKDAILVVLNPDKEQLEMFIAKGQAANQHGLYYLLCDGELDFEIDKLRKAASLVKNGWKGAS